MRRPCVWDVSSSLVPYPIVAQDRRAVSVHLRDVQGTWQTRQAHDWIPSALVSAASECWMWIELRAASLTGRLRK